MGKKILKKLTLKEKKELKMKEVDMVEIKKNIKKEFLQSFGTKEEGTTGLSSYDQKYREYITEEFNIKCVFLIVSFINNSHNLPLHLKNGINLHKELINICKELMMNELEIIIFTILIDKLGWEKKNFIPKIHLLFTALLAKNQTNESINLLINHFKEHQQPNRDFSDSFLKWREDIKDYEVSIKNINERFRQLNKPYNTYCQKDYIDYNSVVDKIIQLSQPYGEENKGNMIIKEESNALEMQRMPSFQPYHHASQRFTQNDMMNDALMLDHNRMNSFVSISSKKDDQDDNFLDLIHSKSNFDPQQLNKQPSDFFNYYQSGYRREPSGLDSDFFGLKQHIPRMKSQISNNGDLRLVQPVPIQQSLPNFDFLKSIIKDKKDS